MSKVSQNKIRVGVLRGGASPEYRASLKTGGVVLSRLPQEKYEPVDMLIAKDGVWHINGIPATPTRVSSNVDVIFNALHGPFGVDGRVHKILGELPVPYTGSSFLDSTIGLNKISTKHQFKNLGIKNPLYVHISSKQKEDGILLDDYVSQSAQEVFEKISPPWVVKSSDNALVSENKIVETMPQLRESIKKIIEQGSGVIVEEYINGREAVSGIIDGFRGQKRYRLLPIEIEAEGGPGSFSGEEKEEMQSIAAELHEKLGLRHYSKTNFIVSPKRGVFVLGVKPLPELEEGSRLHRSLQETGADLSEFLDHLLGLVIEEKNN